MNCATNLLLYAVSDLSWLNGDDFLSQVQTVLQSGVTCFQLREKHLSDDQLLKLALQVKPLCQKYQVPLIINDNVAVAKAADADGVHVGQSDAAVQDARKILGYEKIIGTSAHNVAEAIAAYQNGADYLGCGAVFGSTTKTNVTTLDHAQLSQICKAVPLPVVAIGGIQKHNAAQLCGTGVDGIAVISALFAQKDKAAATKEMLALAKQIRGDL